MKRTLLTCVAVVTLASSAFAADLPPPPVYKAPPPSAPSWTGCYIGGGGGAGFMTSNQNLTAPPSAVVDVGGQGWMGVAGGGCDYQTSLLNWNVVLGAFGDYAFMNFKGTASPGGNTGTMNESGAWAGGARAGVLVVPSVLIYTNGGYTNARVNSITFTPAAITIPAQNYNGWFLGGGTETSLSWVMPGLFLRTEYRYSTYQSNTTGVLRSNLATQSVFTELVWRFNFSGLR